MSYLSNSPLEDSLKRLRVPFSYLGLYQYESEQYRPSYAQGLDSLPILKLHGSVNWSESGDYFDSYESLLGSQVRAPLLLPPTWRKVFGGKLGAIWSEAVKAITEATRIIIVGFSMPTTDIHFRYLLYAGLQDNISLRDFLVVNKASSEDQRQPIKANFNSIFQDRFQSRIEWHWDGAIQFFSSPQHLSSIERGLDTSRFLDLRIDNSN